MPTEPTSRKYQNFDTNPLNNDDPPPTGAPEDNNPDTVNDIQRYDKAAIAELAVDMGVATAEHGLTDQAIGWQPMNDVEFTGGSMSGMTTAVMAAGYVPSGDKDLVSKDWVTSLVGDGLPINTVVMWYGTAATVPNGWAICDGTGGTPDLRSKFVQGATIDGDVGTTGGLASTTSSSDGLHNHSNMTVNGTVLTEGQLPSHTHAVGTLAIDTVSDHIHQNFLSTPSPYNGAQNNLSSNEAPVAYGDHIVGDQFHYRMTSNAGATTEPNVGKSSSEGSHTHTLSGASATTGNGQTHTHALSFDNDGAHTHTVATEPPYAMLYFIMRVS